jgi:PAS domain-containing protein
MPMKHSSRWWVITARILPQATPVEWCEQDERLSAELKVTGFLRPFEKEFLRKDGTRVPVLISTAMFEGSSTEGVAYVLDLTERKRAEKERERLRQLEADLAHINRVSMMGELVASLAHEMKHGCGGDKCRNLRAMVATPAT